MMELERLPILWVVRLDFKVPQREAEWNEWYNTVHASRGLPGALRMSRYECIRGRKANPKYMSITEIRDEKSLDNAISSPEAMAVREEMTSTWGDAVEAASAAAYKCIFRREY